MTREAEWGKRAAASYDLVPPHGRDQIDALVREVCRDADIGAVDLGDPDPLGRSRIAVDGPAVVFFQVIDEDLLRVVRVLWRA